MANTNNMSEPVNSTGKSLIESITRRRKHRNSAVTVASWLMEAHNNDFATNNRTPVNFWEVFDKREVSARKLAADLWRLRFMEVSESASSFPSSMSKLANASVKKAFPKYHNSGEKFKETNDKLRKPIIILRSKKGLRHREFESSLLLVKGSNKVATKRNLALNEASNDFTMIHSKKLLEDKRLLGEHRNSVVTTLLKELFQAQRTINKLKAEKKSLKKKVEQSLQNFEEEKIFWKQRERQKIEAMLDDLEYNLASERRNRERIESLNTKLAHELSEANLLAKQFMTNYEKEKKEKELMEKVCDELATEIGKDMANLNAIISNSIKNCQEVEEERKMMQMAEEWREGRAQMKLIDAQLFLEEKYNQMVKLIAFLRMFLVSKGAEIDTKELEGAELIKQAVESVNIQRIVELSYDFSKSHNIVPIFETFDAEGFNKNSTVHQSTPQRGDTYVVNVNQKKNVSENEAECGEKTCLEFHKTRVNRVRSISAAQSNWKSTSPASKRGKIIIPSKSSQHKITRRRNSANNMNPHITREMNGCIEWPRGIPKANTKVIHLEEVKNQKS